MPRFYFDVLDGFRSPDQDGTELPSVVEARLEAVKFAGAYLSHRPKLVWDGHELRVLVFDERRTLLTTVTIAATDTREMPQRIDAQAAGADEPGNRSPGSGPDAAVPGSE